MKAKRSSMSFSLMFIIAGVLVLGVFFLASLVYVMIAFSKSSTFPYSEKDVVQLCKTFRIPDEDAFCIKGSEQKPETLEVSLERNYPVNVSKYEDIAPLVQSLTRSVWFCREAILYDKCPPPEECSVQASHDGMYSCGFDLSFVELGGGISIWIDTDSGYIKKYEVHSAD